jgi:hypothetical protein
MKFSLYSDIVNLQLLRNFPVFHVKQKFSNMLATALHWSLH